MSFIPPPRESFVHVDADNERVKEAQARMHGNAKVHYDGEPDPGDAPRSQGLLQRLIELLRGRR